MAETQAIHKSGPLKQQNKSHKHGKHRTKGQIAALSKGRVSIKIQSRNTQIQMRKAERKNKMKQLRANKRHVAYMTKRNVGVEGSPPHLVVYHNNSIGVGGVSCTTRLSIKWHLTSIIVPLVQHIVFHLKCLW